MKKIESLYILSIIILASHFIIRLINEARIIFYFPLGFANDISSHIAKLNFLSEYGYHQLVPNWYNGFDYFLFLGYPPGWYYFTSAINFFVNNIQLSTYISILLLYLIGLIIIYYLFGHLFKISKVKRFLFFLLFFANPIAIGYILRVGKFPELTGWVLALISFAMIFYHKDKPIRWPFIILISITLSLMILSNVTSFIVLSPLFLSLFLIKNLKEKTYLCIATGLGLLISAFWWIPFYLSTQNTWTQEIKYTTWLLSPSLSMDQITTVASSLLVIGLILIYLKNKNFKEWLFFSPILAMAILVLSRLIVHIPLYSKLHPDNFTMFFMLISSFLFVTFKLKKEKWIAICLLILIGIGTIFSLFYTPFYSWDHTSTETDIISLLPEVDGLLYYYAKEREVYSRAIYSYGAIYHNTITFSGWMDLLLTKEEKNFLYSINIDNGCEDFEDKMQQAKVENIISIKNTCLELKSCGFQPIKEKGDACLLSTKKKIT